jgi:hypothetical protein
MPTSCQRAEARTAAGTPSRAARRRLVGQPGQFASFGQRCALLLDQVPAARERLFRDRLTPGPDGFRGGTSRTTA